MLTTSFKVFIYTFHFFIEKACLLVPAYSRPVAPKLLPVSNFEAHVFSAVAHPGSLLVLGCLLQLFKATSELVHNLGLLFGLLIDA